LETYHQDRADIDGAILGLRSDRLGVLLELRVEVHNHAFQVVWRLADVHPKACGRGDEHAVDGRM
jgi:hypothetical protein